MRFIIVFMICLIHLGCNSKLQNRLIPVTNGVSSIDVKKYALDLSKHVRFDFRTNKMTIHNESYLNKVIELLNDNQIHGEIIIRLRHEDRLYVDTRMSNILKLKKYLVNKGLEEELIDSFIGFDFGTMYASELEDSLIILLFETTKLIPDLLKD